MPGVDHERHGQRLQGIKRAQQQIHGHELHGASQNSQAHEHGIPESETGHIHIDAISKPQKPESGEDWNGVGKSGPERLTGRAVFCPHMQYLPVTVPGRNRLFRPEPHGSGRSFCQ